MDKGFHPMQNLKGIGPAGRMILLRNLCPGCVAALKSPYF
jgi:hypothetical protein